MLEVRDLRVDYDHVCAVRDLSVTVPDGEVFGLIGPNGAGKTTTLRAIAGLIEPTYGNILIDGIDLHEHRQLVQQRMGFMPDTAPLYEDLMVWEYLDLFAASYNIPPVDRPLAIERVLNQVDLSGKATDMTGNLSRGMKQRLILAKTLVANPQLLLLDEPASGMDPHGRAMLRRVMHELGQQGKTIIISSHILSDLSDFCTSIGIMERGHMVLHGAVEDIVEQVIGTGSIALTVISGEEKLESLLAANSLAGTLRSDGKTFEFDFAGDDAAVSDLLTNLVNNGVRVVSMIRKKADLEDVFLKVGAREVS